MLEEPQPLDVVVAPGPLPDDFRASLDRALNDIIPEGERGATLLLVDVDDRGRPAVLAGFAHRFVDNGKSRWSFGAEFEKKLNGPAKGRFFFQGSWK